MAKKKKGSSYSKMVRKALAKAKREANPAAAKIRKKKKLEASAKKMSKKMTEPEKIFVNMMKELKIEVETQKVIGGKIYDFYVPSKNMIVEVDGDYWHANPLIYEEVDLNRIQIKNVRNDKKKEVIAKGYGYELERVWEYDLKNNYEEQKKRFKKLLKDE